MGNSGWTESDYLQCIRRGANPNVSDRSADDWSPLHFAAFDQDVRVIEALIEAGSNLELREIDGWTPLYVAVLSGSLPVVEALLEAGANPNARTYDGSTALHMATTDEAQMRLLLEHGADPQAKDSNGHTPHDIAAANERQAAVDLLASVERSQPRASGERTLNVLTGDSSVRSEVERDRQRSDYQECKLRCGEEAKRCIAAVQKEDCKVGLLPPDPDCLERNLKRTSAACDPSHSACLSDCGVPEFCIERLTRCFHDIPDIARCDRCCECVCLLRRGRGRFFLLRDALRAFWIVNRHPIMTPDWSDPPSTVNSPPSLDHLKRENLGFCASGQPWLP